MLFLFSPVCNFGQITHTRTRTHAHIHTHTRVTPLDRVSSFQTQNDDKDKSHCEGQTARATVFQQRALTKQQGFLVIGQGSHPKRCCGYLDPGNSGLSILNGTPASVFGSVTMVIADNRPSYSSVYWMVRL